MTENLTEQQQIEVLKRFWKENGTSLIVGIIFALLIVFGWRFHKSYHLKKEQQASAVYNTIVQDVSDRKKISVIKAKAKFLKKNYKKTPYSQLAAFILSKKYISEKKFGEAISQLNWVIEHGSSNTLEQLARIKLARIYVMQKKANYALKILKIINSKAYFGLIFEVRGDALMQLKKIDQAKEAYKRALTFLPQRTAQSSFVHMKLEDIG